MTATISPTTVEAHFQNAIRRVRGGGVHVQINAMTCCRSCTIMEDIGLTEDSTVPYVWTYGGQGFELVWRDGTPYFREEERSPDDLLDDLCECHEAEYDENDEGEEVLVEEYTCGYCMYGTEPKRRDSVASGVYFYHGSLRAAEAVADAMRSEGFRVEWGGDMSKAVYVEF